MCAASLLARVDRRLRKMTSRDSFPFGEENKEITESLFSTEELFDVRPIVEKHASNGIVEYEKKFKVAVGSRVLVEKNMNNIFVNGVIGVVHDVKIYDNHVMTSNSTVHELPIDIANIGKDKWKTNFPINPRFASTYHKAQGQTLDNVFLLADDSIGPALFYMGASRVRTREDLHIFGYDFAQVIHPDHEALTEYKRLRTSVGM